MNKVNSQKGFTIIEVVLVLAIAGLIFLMVFIALPALQRNQRDQQRRSDVGRMISQLTQYQTDNRGKLPSNNSELNNFVSNYLRTNDEQFADPNKGDYTVTLGAASSEPSDGEITYHPGSVCGEGGSVKSGGSRKVAVRVKLEGGPIFCQNN
ncbi:MAG TPA: type II secretion system protein [Verrucomicrobiae bacterium]|nr:type II secretion system protein [Verrucomicrobiae bacterium]